MASNAMFELRVALVAQPALTNSEVAALLAKKGHAVGVNTINTTRAGVRQTLAAIDAVEARNKRASARKAKKAQ